MVFGWNICLGYTHSLQTSLKGGRIEDWLISDNERSKKRGSSRQLQDNYLLNNNLQIAHWCDTVQQHPVENRFFASEPKGNCLDSRGTKDHLIQKMILEKCKRRKTNLIVAWIDHKKQFPTPAKVEENQPF